MPNFGSPEARFGRNGWFHLDVPRHLVHFTPATLAAMLAEAGFEPAKVTHLVPEYDLFSFVQTVENRLGLPPNLLYDVLRRAEARLRGSRAGARARPQSPLDLPPRSARSQRSGAPLAAAMRRSATIAVYAVRIPLSASNGASAARYGAGW